MADVRALFLNLQTQLAARLAGNRAIAHPGAHGEATEVGWRRVLCTYLPRRYRVSKAFAVDSEGQVSEEIDLMIYDRQYSPFLFRQDEQSFVPAESVYAVFEVKQRLNAANIRYAADKAMSVRRLHRMTAQTPHAGGVFARQEPKTILAGILCTESEWRPPFGEPFREALAACPPLGRLELGCALGAGGFEQGVKEGEAGSTGVRIGPPATALMWFLLALQQRLQALGTVATIDLASYRRFLDAPSP